MEWTRSVLCLCLAGVVTLSAKSQESREGISLQAVKYAGLKEAINRNRGKVVLVDFWGNFCVPCKQAFPHTLEIHKKFAQEGLALVSVSLDGIDNPAAREEALRFLKKVGADCTNLFLEESVEFWQKKLGFHSVPCYYVFSRQGQWTRFPAKDDEAVNYDAMENFIAERLREK